MGRWQVRREYAGLRGEHDGYPLQFRTFGLSRRMPESRPRAKFGQEPMLTACLETVRRLIG